MRFKKSFKLAPGVRMNLSGGGISWTLGPRGATVGIGKRGTYLNAGIPGTGISIRQKISGASQNTKKQTPKNVSSLSVTIEVSDDGTITFKDNLGQELSDQLINKVKKQHGDAIKNLIQQKCDEINKEIDAISELHLHTPSANIKPKYSKLHFTTPQPLKPIPKRIGFIRSLFKSQREKVEKQNNFALAEYNHKFEEWEHQRKEFQANEDARRSFIEEKIYNNIDSMSQYLEETLQEIVWPRETIVSTIISETGNIIFIDVDLPEIEDMPNTTAAVPVRGYKLSVKEMSQSKHQKLYMQHIHSIVFRIIGETFAALPNAQEIILSGYSQRPDTTTGKISDEYLISVRVKRSMWLEINFKNLNSVDVVEALTKFELRRSMSKLGVFKSIQPYSP